MTEKDPVGKAIWDFANTRKPADIIVSSDLCEDDIIPVEVLFRNFEDMPLLEQKAMELCRGKILDVGAGAGPHAKYLDDKGFDVYSIDKSKGAVDYLKSCDLKAENIDFFDFKETGFDTILLLMNGIGISGNLQNLENTLKHAKTLIKPGGQILCDSSDVSFLYDEEDGSFWMDLNAEYYGNFKFQMHYKKCNSEPFDWLFVDYDHLHTAAMECGLTGKRIAESDHHYLAQLTLEA